MATILLVDDDANFLSALERVLLLDGHSLHFAADTAAALEQVEKGPVDVVIADLNLCQESGLDLVLGLQQRRPGLPVILLSASPDASSYLEALRLGAYEYLAKPLDFTELRQVVQQALKPVGRPS